MHKCEPSRPPAPPPPVPPRRRRRKLVNDLVVNSKEVDNTNRVKRIDRKRLPPPPPPSQLPRRNKTRFLQENQIQTRITVHVSSSKDQKDESNAIIRSADSDNTNCENSGLENIDKKVEELIRNDELVVRSPVYDRTVKKEESIDSINIIQDNSYPKNVDKRSDELKVDKNNDELFVRSPRYDRIVRREEFNKYPSLFFTLDDIQDVIPDTFTNKEEEMDSQMEKEEIEVNEEPKESFIDNCIEDENDICFRVTPTNFPFEKCLDRWKNSLDGDDFGVDRSNSFIFEDYMDRSNALNVKRSKSALCYDGFDNDETTIEHTATKVRFVIESPSSSTPDNDIQDSLQNVDSITNELTNKLENFVDSKSSHDDADVFGEIPFCSVIESNLDKSYGTCSINSFESVENKDEEEVRVNFPDSSVTSLDNDRFLEDQVPSNTEEEGCSRTEEHEVSQTVDRVNENLAFPEDLNESSNSQKQFNTSERRKIFVTQSLHSFIDDSPVDWEDNESQDGELAKENNSDKLEIDEKKFSREEQPSELSLNEQHFVEPMKEVNTLIGKETEVPVSVRRNSFLEQMLSDDCTDTVWNLACCEIVATHPKNDRLTSIEEQNEKKVTNSDPTNTKNIVDVKTDVLNELLTNFSMIKLKKVENPDKMTMDLKNDETISKDVERVTANDLAVQRIQAEINVSQKLDEDMKNSKIVETDSKDSKDCNDGVEVAEIISDIANEKNTVKLDNPVLMTLKTLNESVENEGETGSAVKCAIVREKTPNVITHRNNDDNNRAVRTPVALSNDQSLGQESSTIIPGSVRSFVKYYEIRRETTAVEDSKINDRRTLDQGSNLVRSTMGQDSVSSRIRRFERKDEIKAAKENTNLSNNLISKNIKKEFLMNPESVSNEISYTMIVKKVIEPSGLRMECVKGSPESRNSFDDSNSNSISESSIKNDRKKSVQFSGEHTVIGSNRVNLENAEELLEDGFSRSGQHLSQETHLETVCERDSGINRFVSNAASNARLVFYCTV